MAASRRAAVDPVTPVQRLKVSSSGSGVKPCTLCPESWQDACGSHVMSTCSTSSPSTSSASPWQDGSLALLPVAEEYGLPGFSVVSAEDDELSVGTSQHQGDLPASERPPVARASTSIDEACAALVVYGCMSFKVVHCASEQQVEVHSQSSR